MEREFMELETCRCFNLNFRPSSNIASTAGKQFNARVAKQNARVAKQHVESYNHPTANLRRFFYLPTHFTRQGRREKCALKLFLTFPS